MLRAVKYWKIECDFPECDRETGDSGDYSAYSDSGGAVDDWDSSDGVRINGDYGAEFFYCSVHAPQECAGDNCNESCIEYVIDGEFYCDECYHLSLEREDAVLVSTRGK